MQIHQQLYMWPEYKYYVGWGDTAILPVSATSGRGKIAQVFLLSNGLATVIKHSCMSMKACKVMECSGSSASVCA